MAVDGGSGPGEHPRGTIALVGLYAVLFVAGWIALHVFLYVARGPVTR